MEEKKKIDFTDAKSLALYGNDTVLEIVKLCNAFEKRAVYVTNNIDSFEMTDEEEQKIGTLKLELNDLIAKGERELESYCYDVQYYKVQSEVLKTLPLKAQHLAHKIRYDLFHCRVKYLVEVRKDLDFTEKRFKGMQLKK